MDAYTEDNETLVINSCPDTEVDPLSMMSWWKANDPGEFKMGSKEYWESAFQSDNPLPPESVLAHARSEYMKIFNSDRYVEWYR